MKKFVCFLLLGLLIRPAFAQKIIEKTLPVTANQLVNLNLKFADSIRVRYWDKPDALVRMAVTINGGKLNDAFLVTTGSTTQEVSLKTDFDKELIKHGNPEDCPNQRSSWNSERDGKHYSVCSEINYQVFLPRNAQLKLETINGNIDIEGATGPVFAKTISGFVDMNWPKSKGANVAMKTVTGEVYSDLTIDFKSKRPKNPMVGYLLEGTLNGGGPTVRLESISNNIYLREKD
ncbi:DUF4097 family beta strand repeat-containing protein [Spirosoma flavum]|uniref:DUF4097 domain-containing protein n=1 Tax=Spirosoma flavum TaxID=2048557 RepID=A0ABW6AQ14_9BACT